MQTRAAGLVLRAKGSCAELFPLKLWRAEWTVTERKVRTPAHLQRSRKKETKKRSKIKKRKKDKQHKKREKKEKKRKQKKKKTVCSGPVQISKFLKDRDKSDKYSMITGKKIKMKVKKTKDDKEDDGIRV
ncbi:hypothetical protein scyTo_0010213 [Scyliorhinus torazame]|uniref:Uncharacterized protein n=1 Tax=Scyliorhinus torazame TaxID=75743 RepID=A0A401P284_SCYTO|nr:hypothetical protein [Scyliorhinus torazame]